MPIVVDGFSGTLWSTKTRKTITVSAAMIAAVLGAYSQIKANADDLEHLVPASRPYARTAAEEASKKALDAVKAHESAEKVTTAEVKRVLHHIQLDQANGKSEATDNDLFKAGLELKKATDDQTREYIQEQINKLQATKHKIDSQIETLNKATNGD